MKPASICFFVRGSKILLAIKKRGFLKGYRNGYGGKFDPEKDLTMLDCGIRETFEESDVVVLAEDMERVAIIDFYEAGILIFRCDIFFMYRWKGKIKETEEMTRPKVFRVCALPIRRFWFKPKLSIEARLWLPKILAGERRRWAIYASSHQGKINKFVDLGPLGKMGRRMDSIPIHTTD